MTPHTPHTPPTARAIFDATHTTRRHDATPRRRVRHQPAEHHRARHQPTADTATPPHGNVTLPRATAPRRAAHGAITPRAALIILCAIGLLALPVSAQLTPDTSDSRDGGTQPQPATNGDANTNVTPLPAVPDATPLPDATAADSDGNDGDGPAQPQAASDGDGDTTTAADVTPPSAVADAPVPDTTADRDTDADVTPTPDAPDATPLPDATAVSNGDGGNDGDPTQPQPASDGDGDAADTPPSAVADAPMPDTTADRDADADVTPSPDVPDATVVSDGDGGGNDGDPAQPQPASGGDADTNVTLTPDVHDATPLPDATAADSDGDGGDGPAQPQPASDGDAAAAVTPPPDAAAAPPPDEPIPSYPLYDGIAAVINAEVITMSELHAAMADDIIRLNARYEGDELRERMVQGQYATLNQMIERTLTLQEAAAQGITISEAEVDDAWEQIRRDPSAPVAATRSKEALREEMAARRVVDLEVRRRILVPFEELRTYYNERQSFFTSPTEYHLRQILLLPRGDETPDAVRARGERLVGQLREGAVFADMAVKFSDGPASVKGGDVGFVRQADLLTPLGAALDALSPGAHSSVIATATGMHILKLEETRAGATQPFDDVKNYIQNQLHQQKLRDAHGAWLSALKDKAYIAIRF